MHDSGFGFITYCALLSWETDVNEPCFVHHYNAVSLSES